MTTTTALLHKTALMAGLAALLAGCGVDPEERRADILMMQNQIVESIVAYQTGEAISEYCPRYNFNYGEERRANDRIVAEAIRQGHSQSTFNIALHSIPEERLDEARIEMELYFRTNRLDPNAPASFCEVGDREVAARSAIGAYLIPR